MTPQDRRFKMALSFPGERRAVVKEVAELLAGKFGEKRVLYDKFHEAEFARPDLDVYLPNLYRAESELIVLFLCTEYEKKRWCNLEWRFIRQIIATHDQHRIMFLSFDDMGPIPEIGILSGDGYALIADRTPQEIAELIIERWNVNSSQRDAKINGRISQPTKGEGSPGGVTRPDMSWRESLAIIQRQFETRAEKSNGLHHMLVEVSDDERDRFAGPDWFARQLPFGKSASEETANGDSWHFVSSFGLPGISPGFREIASDEIIDNIPANKILRDGSGVPRAVAVPMRLRFGYLCGDSTQLDSFKTLAKAASQVLTDEQELRSHPLAEILCDLFRRPRGGVRYTFGDVSSPPAHFITNGWSAGVLHFKNGVLVDVPIAEDFPGVGHWLLLLHRLGWRKYKGCPLTGSRLAWHGNTSVAYELVSEPGRFGLPSGMQKNFAGISGKSYYSILGEHNSPLDVNLASVFAISLILSPQNHRGDAR